MSAKAALQAEGATDWMNYYEPGEGAQGSLKNLESGKEMAALTGAKTATSGTYDDTEPDPGEMGKQMDQAEGEACDRARDFCEDGHENACAALLKDCGWSEDEVKELFGTAVELGEEPGEIYDPVVDQDTGQSFEKWASEAASEPPEEPSDDELAEIAPTRSTDAAVETQMTGAAYRALKKAWGGYKAARAQARQSHDWAEQYAAVINGIRSLNDQEPLDFQGIEEWGGGRVMPDDPSEEFPAPEGGRETMAEAADLGHASSAAQTMLGRFRASANEMARQDPYDPTEEF
jgi:hypothetical protein